MKRLILASLLLGQYGQHLALVERRLAVVADQLWPFHRSNVSPTQ